MFVQPPEILTQTANMFLSVRLSSPERHQDLPGAPLQFLFGRQEICGAAQKDRRREGLKNRKMVPFTYHDDNRQ